VAAWPARVAATRADACDREAAWAGRRPGHEGRGWGRPDSFLAGRQPAVPRHRGLPRLAAGAGSCRRSTRRCPSSAPRVSGAGWAEHRGPGPRRRGSASRLEGSAGLPRSYGFRGFASCPRGPGSLTARARGHPWARRAGRPVSTRNSDSARASWPNAG
jgi:hypothetical protein